MFTKCRKQKCRKINDYVGNRNVLNDWCTKCRKQKCLKRQINDFDVQNVGNRNVQKLQINDLDVQNV